MEKLDKSAWPALIVSDRLNKETDEGCWLREIVTALEEEQDCSVLVSFAYGDAHDLIFTREDLGAIVIDWDLEDIGRMHKKNAIPEVELNQNRNAVAQALLKFIRKRNRTIPIFLLTDRVSIEDIPDGTLAKINEVIWKLADTVSFIAGRIERQVIEYSTAVLPPFFQELVTYVNEYKYAWHTPGHMGGQGFLTSPSGTALHKFFGENVLRADLSISVPELGSLLDHSGFTGAAEEFSAQVFGADQTYYVLNGTSTANQIIWRSQVSPGQTTLMDRNCHKSLNYAMIITEAKPVYMEPMRNGLGIIGPVDFSKIKWDKSYTMAALTNSTYDGVCYDTAYVHQQLEKVRILHFDEAWYAYAKFHDMYKKHFGMALPASEKLVFCSQSTHKLLTAFSQASMIHVKLPGKIKQSPEKRAEFHDLFNESYMMHGSTSPQYSMVASLEVATKMMQDNGSIVFSDIIKEAIELRRKIAWIKQEKEEKPPKEEEAGKKPKKDWFFGIWQPPCIADKDLSVTQLAEKQDYWLIRPGDTWHGFAVKDTYTMLDPIKLTFTCPGIDINGVMSDPKDGPCIPANIVTNYLINQGIVCEKTDYYSWLLLNSPGTTKGKQGTLVAELFKFKELYDKNAPLVDVFPELVAMDPKQYQHQGLKDHCSAMHESIKKHKLLALMRDAFKVIPDHDPDMNPAQAYRYIVEKTVEQEELRFIKTGAETPRVAAVMLVPYPPGIPIMMGGEKFNRKAQPILDYLLARQEFENEFPGYESDIHGIDRTAPDKEGKKYFKTWVLI
jgi:arginine decarboxylase